MPPTLVSFAVDIGRQKDIVTPELKKAGDKLVRFSIRKDQYDLPVYENVTLPAPMDASNISTSPFWEQTFKSPSKDNHAFFTSPSATACATAGTAILRR